MNEYTNSLPTAPGLYEHQWLGAAGHLKSQTLFVGYTNARAPKLQGMEPNAFMPRKLKCCQPEEHLHADRLTPKEWGGFWRAVTNTKRISALAQMEQFHKELRRQYVRVQKLFNIDSDFLMPVDGE